MSNPCLPTPLVTSKRKREDDVCNGRNSPLLKKKMAKKTQVAFDAIESMNANSYLSKVIREAKEMSDVFVADISSCKSSEKVEKPSHANLNDEERSQSPSRRNFVPIDGSAASLLYLLSRRASITPPPSIRYLPETAKVDEWSKSVLSNFESLRGYLEKCKAQGFGGKQSARKPVPTMKDRFSWHVFCVGIDDASGNFGAYFADEYSDDNAEDFKQNKDRDKKNGELPSWRINLPTEGYKPSVCLLLQMDQMMIRRVLSHLAYYVDLGWAVTAGRGRRAEWIYALLARLEMPVHRDDAAVLFGLLKSLTLDRSKIDLRTGEKGRSDLAKLNVLIILIGLYFGQGGSLNKIMACAQSPE